MEPVAKRVMITTVARAAGVSAATVSLVLNRRDRALQIAETQDQDAEIDALPNLGSGDSAGVSVATTRHRAFPRVTTMFREVVRRGLPAITLIDFSLDPRIPVIRNDDKVEAHLARLGHWRIAYLTDATAAEREREQPAHAVDRSRGYRRALEAGVAFNPA